MTKKQRATRRQFIKRASLTTALFGFTVSNKEAYAYRYIGNESLAGPNCYAVINQMCVHASSPSTCATDYHALFSSSDDSCGTKTDTWWTSNFSSGVPHSKGTAKSNCCVNSSGQYWPLWKLATSPVVAPINSTTTFQPSLPAKSVAWEVASNQVLSAARSGSRRSQRALPQRTINPQPSCRSARYKDAAGEPWSLTRSEVTIFVSAESATNASLEQSPYHQYRLNWRCNSQTISICAAFIEVVNEPSRRSSKVKGYPRNNFHTLRHQHDHCRIEKMAPTRALNHSLLLEPVPVLCPQCL